MSKGQEFLDSTNKIIKDTIKEYSVQDFAKVEVDNNILNQCESSISPIMLLKRILAKVRGNTIKFLAQPFMWTFRQDREPRKASK